MTTHEWSRYDIEKAQIQHAVFESEDGVVKVTVEVMEQILRERGFKPKEEFDRMVEAFLDKLGR